MCTCIFSAHAGWLACAHINERCVVGQYNFWLVERSGSKATITSPKVLHMHFFLHMQFGLHMRICKD